LQNASAKRAEITLDSLLAEADEIQQQAQAAGQFGAANAALKLKSELSGHYVARKEAKVETTTAATLTSVVAQLLGKGDGEVQVVPAVGSGTVVRFRESQGKKTYLVPANIAKPYALLPEVVSTEEWMRDYVPKVQAEQMRLSSEPDAKKMN
jgi:hypothetical protein